MKKLKLNIAIAGCYKVVHLHVKAIQQIENGNLKAALSRSQESVLKFAEQYDIKTYQDISRMVTENEIDNVIICKTHPFHLQPTVSALAGAHVMVENPLASNLEDCDLMLDACRKSHVKLGVIFQRRWYEPVRRVKKAKGSGFVFNTVHNILPDVPPENIVVLYVAMNELNLR